MAKRLSVLLRAARFFISNTFISNTRLKLIKNKQMLNNTLRLNFCYLKIIRILHPRYHLKIIRHILKNKPRNKCDCFHVIIRLIIMKMKNRSYGYDINRPRSRHGRKYSKYEKLATFFIYDNKIFYISSI